MLEHDILAVQARLAENSATPELQGRQFNERELQALRESGPAIAGKLALHEILAEKLMCLERAMLHATGGQPVLPTPELSRLPSLLAIVERLQSAHLHSARAAPPSRAERRRAISAVGRLLAGGAGANTPPPSPRPPRDVSG